MTHTHWETIERSLISLTAGDKLALVERLVHELRTVVDTNRLAPMNRAKLLTEDEFKHPLVDRVDPTAAEPMPAWQRILEHMKQVPNEVFNRIPVDSSEQLDHYIYGTPKRPPKRPPAQ